jgi:sigma-B regulation protein RsbU (phosphoserine phosphatase)
MPTDPKSLQSPDTLRALQHENADLRDENRHLREEVLRLRNAILALKDLQDSLGEITPESDPHALVDRILSLALEAVDSENGSLLLTDQDSDELVFVSVQGPLQEALDGFRLAPGEGIAGWVVSSLEPLLVPDVRHEPRWSPSVDQTTGFRTTSLICVPLIHQDRALGALEVVNTHSGDFFNEEDLDVMLLFARLAVQALVLAE